MEFNGLDRYCLYNVSLNLRSQNIFCHPGFDSMFIESDFLLEEMFPLHLLYVFRLCHRYHLGYHVNRC